MTFILQGSFPSKKNSKRLIMRGGKRFLVPSALHEAWHEEAMYALRSLLARGKVERVSGPVRISVTLYAPNRRSGDLSNKWESIGDLLVDAGIIEDDNWFIVTALDLRLGGIDPNYPRAEIDIVKLSTP